jgi:Domain of unknown function (DUF4382)
MQYPSGCIGRQDALEAVVIIPGGSMKTWKWALAVCAIAILTALFLIGCSNGSSSSGAAAQGMVNVRLSDPPTCRGTTVGSFDHIYVTITDVAIHTSATAGNSDAGWVDLTPNLNSAPVQVDLLNIPTNGCFLATLGTAGIPAGTYQQIRLKLATNNTPVSGTNPCGAVANCAVLSGSVFPLQLNSQANTGIKIPSGQIAGGNFTIAAGQTKDLNIDFDGCASVLLQTGTGQYMLKPVLHAGEVSTTNSTAIVGRLVNQSGTPITGKAVVALEQKDGAGVDRMVMQVATDPVTGAFVFCPVTGTGTFDVVAVAIDSLGNAYGPTMVTGNIIVGTTVGDVRLMLAGTNGAGAAAIFGGPVTTAGSATTVAITVSALQTVNSTQVTIPAAVSASPSNTLVQLVTTGGTGSYTFSVPAATVLQGAFSGGSITYGAGAALNPSYTVEARAFSTSTGDPTCSTNTFTNTINNVAVNSNNTVPPFAFTGCN